MKEVESSNFKEANISLILNDYNDIFSDFDPRNYAERALSDDFLTECRRAARDKDSNHEIDIKLLVPGKHRNANDERTIKKRLISHFQKHFNEKHKEIKSIKNRGVMWFFIGSLIMFGVTLTTEYSNFLWKYITILGEPAGWFMFWEGLGKVFILSKNLNPDLEFYKKMAHANIIFSSY